VPAPDDQQRHGGTQSALSTTLLLWTSSIDTVSPGVVDEQHCRRPLLLIIL
jgi:hypothetical protein